MRSVFDLPAHPLFVHAPIVLMPLTAAGAVVLTLRSSWRRRFVFHLLAAVTVVLATTVLAMRSGGPFKEAVERAGGPNIDKHEDLANITRLWILLMFVLTAALAFLVRRGGEMVTIKHGRAGAKTEALVGISIALVGILGAIWMARTGHEGATLVWKGTPTK